MTTECTQTELEFQGLGSRRVTARFDGGAVTSDAGGLLLRETDERLGLLARFAECFVDHRDAARIEHSVEELLRQRVMGLALGYEDLNDHDALRHDPLLATLAGKRDVVARGGKPLAGKSTLNRLELTPAGADGSARYKKIVADEEKIEAFFVDVFLGLHAEAPDRIVLDLDATDDPLHGEQEGRFFHGYYRSYCYLPLYIFCGPHLLCAQLRPSNADGAAGAKDALARIVGRIRARWPETEIVVRGDSGFCREEIMAWCEAEGIGYVLGLARNARLVAEIEAELAEAKAVHAETGEAARVFKDFTYQTRTSWSCARRVVAKAEHLSRGANPRFVVTSLDAQAYTAQTVYARQYAARGDMENRIKEQQLDLFADRTSSHTIRANQLRLWLSSVAYLLLNALRVFALRATSMARAQCSTIRTRLLKIGARVRLTARRLWVSLASATPYREIFAAAWRNLQRLEPLRL